MKSSPVKRLVFSIVLIALMAAAYHYHQTNEQIRKPTAIPDDVLDTKQFVKPIFNDTLKKVILNEIQIIEKKNKIGIKLNAGKDAKLSYLCQSHKELELQFQAEGIAYSGEVPILKIRFNCILDADGSFKAVWLPIEQIQKEKASDNIELSYYSDVPVSIEITSFFKEWPQHWVLVGANFKDSKSGSYLEITQREVIKELDYPLSMHWEN